VTLEFLGHDGVVDIEGVCEIGHWTRSFASAAAAALQVRLRSWDEFVAPAATTAGS
jgi:hypothetical protein